MDKTKNIYYGNFNITYGDEHEEMLVHFADFIYPAFKSDISRKVGDIEYKLVNVKLKKYLDNDIEKYALVGNFTKSMTHIRETSLINNQIVYDHDEMESTPYSRFIIFLENHRMVLVKNQSKDSPRITSFQTTVREILKEYRKNYNKNQRKNSEKLPQAYVNIVDMPLDGDIDKEFEKIDKINSFRISIHPLNGDIEPLSVLDSVETTTKDMGSKTSNLTFNTPKNKGKVKKMFKEIKGYSTNIIEYVDINGGKGTLKPDKMKSNEKINLSTDLDDESDEMIISTAKNNASINVNSEQNKNIYEKVIAMLNDIFNNEEK